MPKIAWEPGKICDKHHLYRAGNTYFYLFFDPFSVLETYYLTKYQGDETNITMIEKLDT